MTCVEVVDSREEQCSFSDLSVGEWFMSPRHGLMLKVANKLTYTAAYGRVREANWNPDDLVRVSVKISVVR